MNREPALEDPMRPDSDHYWDSVAGHWQEARPQRLWRTYCNRINGDLIRRLLSDHRVDRALKTDLFDEATSTTGLVPDLAAAAASIYGCDVSLHMASLAQAAHAELRSCTTDARSLPFADGSFDLVLSNSTLDHFEVFDDIGKALAEITRVLRPGGRLLLTLDNLANPVVALRSVLPHRLLKGAGLVPYYTGATCGPRRLRRLLQGAELEILDFGAMMHCPRVPAVMTAKLVDSARGGTLDRRFIDFLLRWEVLEKLPTRYLTGYFIAVLAARPSG